MAVGYVVFEDSWQGTSTALAILFLVGLVYGVIAAWFVTRRFKRENKIISVWQQGNFTPRIAVSRLHDDVRTERNLSLNKMADDLESLFSLREIMVATEERNRVARELHDTVKQNLFALNLQLAAIKHKNNQRETLEHITEAKKITREAQRDLVEIITQLHPPAHNESQFYQRISTLAEDIWQRFKVEIKWAEKESVQVTQKQEHALFRIAQEAVNNAIRHGEATRVVMALFQKDNVNYWTISDNGQGFSVKDSPTGFGLTSMRERTAELPEGIFSIGSDSGKGVVINVQWRVN